MDSLANIVGGSSSKIGVTSESPPIYLFGSEYPIATESKEQEANVEKFLTHFRQLIWLTYRRNFIPMKPPSSYTTDTGWGCMLRSAQMILAQVLQRHLFGLNVWKDCAIDNVLKEKKRLLLRWFVDAPTLGAFYSIHRMTQCGLRYDKQPGEWYGPTTAALVLRDLVEAHGHRGIDEQYKLQTNNPIHDNNTLESPDGQRLSMIVADDGTIYINEVLKLCESEVTLSQQSKGNGDPLLSPPPPPKWHTALFILMPLRLGLDNVNADYIEPLFRALAIEQCVGMIGGKPAHSLYFVGSQGDGLLYLDPHTVQPAATDRTKGNGLQDEEDKDESTMDSSSHSEENVEKVPPIHDSSITSESHFLPSDDDLETYQCSDAKLMPAKDIDPSLALGFYCSSRLEFDSLCNRIAELKNVGLPILNTMLDRPDYQAFLDEDELGFETDDKNEAVNQTTEDSDDDNIGLDQFHDSVSMEENAFLNEEGNVTGGIISETVATKQKEAEDFVLL